MIGQFWDSLPPGVHEVRVPKLRKDGPRHWWSSAIGYFDNRAAFVDAVHEITGQDAPGVYVTLNAVDPALLARAANRIVAEKGASATADADIPHLTRLLIDIDAGQSANTSATDAQVAAALTLRDTIRHFLTEEFAWPSPVAVVASGNGGHLIYALDFPNDAEHVAVLQQCLAALAALFN